jgi:carboxylesterase type B
VGRFFYKHIYSSGDFAKFGASHGFELLFLFDTLAAAGVSPTPAEQALVKTFQDLWSGFARTGAVPASWKRYDAQKDNHVIFDTVMSEGDQLHAKFCDFWDTLPAP